jgi:hypothetical protein
MKWNPHVACLLSYKSNKTKLNKQDIKRHKNGMMYDCNAITILPHTLLCFENVCYVTCTRTQNEEPPGGSQTLNLQ